MNHLFEKTGSCNQFRPSWQTVIDAWPRELGLMANIRAELRMHAVSNIPDQSRTIKRSETFLWLVGSF